MPEPVESVPAIMAPPARRDNPWTRSRAGVAGIVFLITMMAACFGSLPWTLAPVGEGGVPAYASGEPAAGRLPPAWAGITNDQRARLNALTPIEVRERAAALAGGAVDDAASVTTGPAADLMRSSWPTFALGTDVLGRSVLVRCLAGGAISLGIGLAAALLSVFIGTAYGTIAGYAGGRVDGVMMRIVDVLYGLPYVLLVVLLAVAVDAVSDRAIERRSRESAAQRTAYVEREIAKFEVDQRNDELRRTLGLEAMERFGTGELSPALRNAINVVTLLVAIGGVSWLTMARVIRGQVLSLKAQPFIEAARAMGASHARVFARHLLPNLLGPIIVYATLTVPQAILQESFLSFLGIGIKPPLPSWGNLVADGLPQLNPYQSNWWLLVFPCLLLALTLLALNFVGEGLREAFDPKRARR